MPCASLTLLLHAAWDHLSLQILKTRTVWQKATCKVQHWFYCALDAGLTLLQLSITFLMFLDVHEPARPGTCSSLCVPLCPHQATRQVAPDMTPSIVMQNEQQGEQQAAGGDGMDMPAGGDDQPDMPATQQHTLAPLQDLGLISGSSSGQHVAPAASRYASAQPAPPSPPGTPACHAACRPLSQRAWLPFVCLIVLFGSACLAAIEFVMPCDKLEFYNSALPC